jgi:DNA-directed RNA polymerase specialized sigma24 family protein
VTSSTLFVTAVPPVFSPVPPGLGFEAMSAIRRWTRCTPIPLQRIYQLLYVEGRTQADAAKQLGVSQPRVAALHRSLLMLGRTNLPHYQF